MTDSMRTTRFRFWLWLNTVVITHLFDGESYIRLNTFKGFLVDTGQSRTWQESATGSFSEFAYLWILTVGQAPEFTQTEPDKAGMYKRVYVQSSARPGRDRFDPIRPRFIGVETADQLQLVNQ